MRGVWRSIPRLSSPWTVHKQGRPGARRRLKTPASLGGNGDSRKDKSAMGVGNERSPFFPGTLSRDGLGGGGACLRVAVGTHVRLTPTTLVAAEPTPNLIVVTRFYFFFALYFLVHAHRYSPKTVKKTG